jgi:hypothetical protein
VEKYIDDFCETLIKACNLSINRYRTTKKTATHKTVPWWNTDLTVQRKRTNAFRRLYQRTKRMNSEKREKYNISKVKQRTQPLSKVKNSNPGKSTVTRPQPQIPGIWFINLPRVRDMLA